MCHSRICRVLLIRSALASSVPGASNGVPNFKIWPFGSDLVTVEGTFLDWSWKLVEQKSPKVSDSQVWPTVAYARVGAFQGTSNYYHSTNMRAAGTLFLKTMHKMEYRLYSWSSWNIFFSLWKHFPQLRTYFVIVFGQIESHLRAFLNSSLIAREKCVFWVDGFEW